jgi:hypothetical protein
MSPVSLYTSSRALLIVRVRASIPLADIIPPVNTCQRSNIARQLKHSPLILRRLFPPLDLLILDTPLNNGTLVFGFRQELLPKLVALIFDGIGFLLEQLLDYSIALKDCRRLDRAGILTRVLGKGFLSPNPQNFVLELGFVVDLDVSLPERQQLLSLPTSSQVQDLSAGVSFRSVDATMIFEPIFDLLFAR